MSLSDIRTEPQLRLQLRGVGEGRGKEARMAPLSSECSRLSARPWERPSCQLWPLQPPPSAGLDRRVTEPEQVALNFFRDSPVPKKTRHSGPPWLLLGSFPTSLLLSHPRSSKQSGERVGPVPPAARTCSDPEGSWDSVLSTLSTHPSSPISSSPLTSLIPRHPDPRPPPTETPPPQPSTFRFSGLTAPRLPCPQPAGSILTPHLSLGAPSPPGTPSQPMRSTRPDPVAFVTDHSTKT